MREKTTTKVIGALLVTVLFTLLVINPAAAYDFPTAESHITLFNNYSGDIVSSFPAHDIQYDIEQPEDVVVKYKGFWDDQRTYPASDATFYYNVSATYNSVFYYDDHTEITNGGESSSHTCQITLPNVNIGTITITYNATLDAPNYYETHEEPIEYEFV